MGTLHDQLASLLCLSLMADLVVRIQSVLESSLAGLKTHSEIADLPIGLARRWTIRISASDELEGDENESGNKHEVFLRTSNRWQPACYRERRAATG